MTSWTKNGITLVAATLLSAQAWAGERSHGHGHSHNQGATFSAGEPGNPKLPARTVQVTMDGRVGRKDDVRSDAVRDQKGRPD